MATEAALNLSGLRPFQVDHARLLARCLFLNHGALDASDTGTGKAYVGSWIARTFRTTPLVICPKSVKADWGKAMQLMGAQAEIVNYERARGAVKQKGDLASSEWGYEQAVGKGSRWIWRHRYELGIFDEVDRCGGMTSLNSKMLIAAVRQFKYVLCLSATAAEDPRQLKALGFALRLFTLDRFKWWLLSRGCKPGLWGGFEFLGASKKPAEREKGREAMVKIHREIFDGGKGARMRKAEIPGFPKTQIEVKLIEDETGKAKQLAADLAEAYAEKSALEYLTALRQKLELLKVPHLIELAEHYAKTSRVIVFVNYKRTAEALAPFAEKLFYGQSDQTLPMRQPRAEVGPQLSSMSRLAHAGVEAQAPPPHSGAAQASELPQLREGLSQPGASGKETLRALRRSEHRDAPRGLQRAAGRGLALPVVSSPNSADPALPSKLRIVIDGSNTEAEREEIKRLAQANQIPVLICNVQAGGVGIGLHDPTGQVERTSLISPCYSARALEQVFGRTPRDGAAFSLQLLIAFANTLEAEIASVAQTKRGNLMALNDAVFNGCL